MSRRPDPELEHRILDAAHRLWKRGGEEALTIRAVAKAAGTNTPAVYRRFKNRNDILRGLIQRIQVQVRSIVEPCGSPAEIAQALLDYALAHPREYELTMSGAVPTLADGRPNLNLALERTARWLGGSPADHEKLVFAVWALTHGTASSLNSKALSPEEARKMRAAFNPAVEALIQQLAPPAKR